MRKKIQQQVRSRKVLRIPINGILIDGDLQIRNEVYTYKVEQYAQAYKNGAVFPPVEVGKKGNGFVLIDGFHRLGALKKIRADVVEAVVTDEPESEWKWIAAKRNLVHGKPLTKDEILNAFRAYMNAGKYMNKYSRALKSYREIAADLMIVKHTTLWYWMKKYYPEVSEMLRDKDNLYGAMEGKKVKDDSDETIEKITASLEFALAMSKTLDGNGVARGKVIEKAQEVLELMKQQGAWVLPQVNDDF